MKTDDDALAPARGIVAALVIQAVAVLLVLIVLRVLGIVGPAWGQTPDCVLSQDCWLTNTAPSLTTPIDPGAVFHSTISSVPTSSQRTCPDDREPVLRADGRYGCARDVVDPK